MKFTLTLRTRFIVSAVLIMVLAQLFSAGLSVSSFEKTYIHSLISTYQIVGKDLKRNIENAMRFGKPLTKFLGMKKLLTEVKNKSQDLSDISIFNTEGRVLYSLFPEQIGAMADAPLRVDEKALVDWEQINRTAFNLSFEGQRHILCPLLDQKKKWHGTIHLSFPEDIIQNHVKSAIGWSLKNIGFISVVATLLIAISLMIFVPFTSTQAPPKRRIFLIMFIFIAGAQIVSSTLNVGFFRERYYRITYSKIQALTLLLEEDIERVLAKGVRLDRLIKIEQSLEKIITEHPEIDSIRIEDLEDTILYTVNQRQTKLNEISSSEPGNGNLSIDEPEKYLNRTTLVSRGGNRVGFLDVFLSRPFIETKLREIILDSATVLIISFLFSAELISFLFLQIVRRSLSSSRLQRPKQVAYEYYHLIRPFVFTYFFGCFLSLSFLPLHMKRMFSPIFGLSEEIFIGLPISAEMLTIALSIGFSGAWIDRKGWYRPCATGMVLSIGGAVFSGLVQNPVWFIASRAVVGLGYGLTLMAFQGFILIHTGPKNRAQGIATLIAGLYAGQICGSAAGGMLADQMDFARVFFVAAGIIVACVLFMSVYSKDFFKKIPLSLDKAKKTGEGHHLLRFLFDKNLLSLLFFSCIPGAICLVGLINYATPVYLDRLGSAPSDIGRVMMVFGLCLIYITPLISRMIDRAHNKKIFIIISGILAAAGLLIFKYMSGLPATILAVFLLGLSCSFGFASQALFVLELDGTKMIGQARAIGIYRAIERIGQMIGPIAFGAVIAGAGFQAGISLMGAALLLTVMFFIIGTAKKKRKDSEKIG